MYIIHMTMTQQQAIDYADKSSEQSGNNRLTYVVTGIECITNRIYNDPHEFINDSYDPRAGWYNPTLKNSYLIPHQKEDSTAYLRRKASTTYDNYVASIVDTIISPLFRNEITYTVENASTAFSLAVDKIFNDFQYQLFLMSSIKKFKLHDIIYSVVEPMQEYENMQGVIDDYIPDIYTIEPHDIKSITQVRDIITSIEYVTHEDYQMDDKCKQYTVLYTYTTTAFKGETLLWQDNEGHLYNSYEECSNKESLTRLTINDVYIDGFSYEFVPVVEFKKTKETTINSTPQIWSLCLACWDYFNIKSLVRELYYKITFPFLTFQSDDDIDSIIIGLNNLLKYPKGTNKPEYIKVETTAHKEMREGLGEIRETIFKLFLQGLQTEETKFTSADSNNVSKGLFLDHVKYLSKYISSYSKQLLINIIYVMLGGNTPRATISNLITDTLTIDYHFNLDTEEMTSELTLAYYKILNDISMEDPVVTSLLVNDLTQKLNLRRD